MRTFGILRDFDLTRGRVHARIMNTRDGLFDFHLSYCRSTRKICRDRARSTNRKLNRIGLRHQSKEKERRRREKEEETRFAIHIARYFARNDDQFSHGCARDLPRHMSLARGENIIRLVKKHRRSIALHARTPSAVRTFKILID